MNKINLPWLLFYLFQIIVFQFYAAPRLSRFGLALMRLRNRDAFQKISRFNRFFHSPWIDYSFGILLSAYLLYGYSVKSDKIINQAHILSVLAFLLTCLLIDGYRSFQLKKKLPLERVRFASLVPRAIGKIVPRYLWLGLFIFSTLVFWLTTDKFHVFLVNMSVSVFGLGVGFFIERRRPVINNVEADYNYRRSEAWTIFYVFLTLPCIFLIKHLFPDAVLSAVISAVPIIFFIYFLNSKLYKNIIS